MIQAIPSSETSVVRRATRRHNPDDGILNLATGVLATVQFLRYLSMTKDKVEEKWMRGKMLPKRKKE
jgi:hypothetical protein